MHWTSCHFRFGVVAVALTAGVLAMSLSLGFAQEKLSKQKTDKGVNSATTVGKEVSGKAHEKKLEGTAGGKLQMGLTPAREAAALAFVREHHPELDSLLASLKDRQPKQYEAAIRDLFRHSERLASWQERDAQRYDLELQAWKLQSRVQLLSATVLMNPQDEAAQAKLKQAILEELRLKRTAFEMEREQVARRLQKLDEQLKKFDTSLENSAEQQFQAVLATSRARAKESQKSLVPVGRSNGGQ